MTELVATTSGGLEAQMKYAQALAAASLVPKQYQRQPANILVAMEYGRSLGLDVVTAMQLVHIVEGKPAASAQLIGALVRRAGHRLRVTGDATKAVAEIIRKDDPDFVFRSEWTMDRARAAGLAGKGTWKQYPDAMLKARAITEVARDACPEALSGVSYTPEELGASDHAPAADWTSVAPEQAPAAPVHVDVETGEIVDAEIVETHEHDARQSYPASDKQLDFLAKLAARKGFQDLDELFESGAAADMLGHPVQQAGLAKYDASALIEWLKRDLGMDDAPKQELPADDPWAVPADEAVPAGPKSASGKQVALIRALFAELKIPNGERPDMTLAVTNHEVQHLEQLTASEASALIDHLNALKGTK